MSVRIHIVQIAQRLKSAMQTGNRSLKLALDVAEKFNDIIPTLIPVVNAVIGNPARETKCIVHHLLFGY